MGTPGAPSEIYTPPNSTERFLILEDTEGRAEALIQAVPALRRSWKKQNDDSQRVFRSVEHEATKTGVMTLESDGGVTVSVEGIPVGRLKDEDASEYQKPLLRLHAAGYMPTIDVEMSVHPPISNESIYLNATAQAAAPVHMVPRNREPLSGIAVLPWHRSYKVSNIAENAETLAPYRGEEGKSLVIATLHKVDGEGKRKDYIAVHIDGTPVGRLSPSTSERLMPAAEHVQSNGLTLGAWGLLTGSEIAAELHVRVRAAAELPQHWLKSPTRVPDIPEIIPSDETEVHLPDPTPPAELSEPAELTDRRETNTREAARPARSSTETGEKAPKQSGGFMWMLAAIVVFIILVAVFGT